MSVVRRESRRRWSLVAAMVVVLVGAPLGVAALPVRAPGVDAERLRELILGSTGQAYQGYAESTATFGVPELPELGEVTSLLNGTTRIRAWYRSATQWRFDVLTAGGERGVYRTPAGEFVWDSGANMLTRFVGEPPLRLPRAGDLLPPELARRALVAAPGDAVEELPPRRVAGVAAVGVRLRPADPDTAVAHVDVWADPATGLPLRVELTARGAGRPVLVSRFLELATDAPTPDVLVPSRPRDAGLAEVAAPDVASALGVFGRIRLPLSLAGRDLRARSIGGVFGVGLYGTGLSAFVAVPLPGRIGGPASDAASKAGATRVELPGGPGELLTIPPLSLLIVRSAVAGRWFLLAGLVDPALLTRAAAELSVLPGGRR